MRAADVPLSGLGGDRRRYNRFDWELAGRDCCYDVTSRSLPGEPTVSQHVRRYEQAAADRDLIQGFHERKPAMPLFRNQMDAVRDAMCAE